MPPFWIDPGDHVTTPSAHKKTPPVEDGVLLRIAKLFRVRGRNVVAFGLNLLRVGDGGRTLWRCHGRLRFLDVGGTLATITTRREHRGKA